jgi:flagellar assembly factor FliW
MSAASIAPDAPADTASPAAESGAGDLRASSLEIQFPDGLVGLPRCRHFLLSRAAAPGTFWLESVDTEGLAFLLVDPFPFFDDYSVQLAEEDLRALGGGTPADIAVLAIVTLPGEPGGTCTANLQAPLAFNLRTGRARQIVLPRSDFGVRCPLAWDLAA